jgi:hypothetical protein
MDSFVRAGAIPRAHQLDPEITRWLGFGDIDVSALVEAFWTGDATQQSCDQLFAVRDRIGPSAALAATVCARMRPEWFSSLPPPKLDRSSPASFLFSATDLANRDPKADLAPLRAELHEMLRREPSALGRSQIATSLSALDADSGQTEAVHEDLLMSLRDNPSDATTWIVLRTTIEGKAQKALMPALAGWVPQAAESWEWLAVDPSRDPATQMRLGMRAFVLAPNPGRAAVVGRNLLLAGRIEDTRMLVSSLPTDSPEDREVRDFLLARIDLAEARVGGAFDRLRTMVLGRAPGPITSNVTYYVMTTMVFAGDALGRGQELADPWVERFVLPATEQDLAAGEAYTIALCMRARRDLATRCLEIMQRHASTDKTDWFYGGRTFLAGFAPYLKGDRRGAIAAWRPLFAEPAWTVLLPPDLFDEAGELDLADTIDSTRAHFGWLDAEARMALRAEKRGDHERARQLVEHVVGAWGHTDVDIRALTQARQLLHAPAK